MRPRWASKPRWTDQLVVGGNVTLTLTKLVKWQSSERSQWSEWVCRRSWALAGDDSAKMLSWVEKSSKQSCSLWRRVSEVSGSAGGLGSWQVKTQPRYSELSSQSEKRLSRVGGQRLSCSCQLWDWESPGRLGCSWESPERLSCSEL
jgi:hypothetical protein